MKRTDRQEVLQYYRFLFLKYDKYLFPHKLSLYRIPIQQPEYLINKIHDTVYGLIYRLAGAKFNENGRLIITFYKNGYCVVLYVLLYLQVKSSGF